MTLGEGVQLTSPFCVQRSCACVCVFFERVCPVPPLGCGVGVTVGVPGACLSIEATMNKT